MLMNDFYPGACGDLSFHMGSPFATCMELFLADVLCSWWEAAFIQQQLLMKLPEMMQRLVLAGTQAKAAAEQ